MNPFTVWPSADAGEFTGLHAKATERILDQLVARVDAWLPDLETLPFDGRIRHKLRRAIDYRRRQLAGVPRRST